jgi:hypothetical protein
VGRAGRVLLATVLVVPFAGAPLGARLLCDRIARRAAGVAAEGATVVARARPARDADDRVLAGIGDPATVWLPLPTEGEAGGPFVADPRKPKKPAPLPRRGLLVRAAVVARAVESGVRPSGVPVPATGQRPAGLALQGIGGFGAGLADGDVLTSVGGTPATSVGAVVGAVAGAIRSNAKALGAVVWRGDRRIDVTVEIPRVTRASR